MSAVVSAVVSADPATVVTGTLPLSAAPNSGSSFAHGGIDTSVPTGTTAIAKTMPSFLIAMSGKSVM